MTLSSFDSGGPPAERLAGFFIASVLRSGADNALGATQWVKPGLLATVKHLRGEADLRHASLQDFREE